jgi:hypothetical protein
MEIKSLHISRKLSLPLDAALWRFGFLAVSGAGKTYNASVLAEEFVNNGIPIAVIDGIGIWWGLRVGVEGHKGLPVVVVGGDHEDIELPSKSATVKKGQTARPQVDEERFKGLIKAILESHVSVVLDTSAFSKTMQRRIVTIFCEEIYRLNKNYGTRHVFIEEADMYAPQRGSPEIAQCMGAVDELIRRGGNFNLGSSLISQRPAVVNKDVLTQINCLVAGCILADIDKKAVATWVKSAVDTGATEKWFDSLKDLGKGEAWVWHPIKGEEIFERVQFRARETLHASREFYRQSHIDQKTIKVENIDAVIDTLKERFEPKKQTILSFGYDSEGKRMDSVRTEIVSQPSHFKKQLAISNQKPDVAQAKYNAMRAAQLDPASVQVDLPLPNIEIHQFRPTLQIPVELTQYPETMIGKLAVLLYEWSGKPTDVSQRKLIQMLQEHAWQDDGLVLAIDQFIRWEILVKNSRGVMTLDKSRIQVIDVGATLQVS